MSSDGSFARTVDRGYVAKGAEEWGVPLPELVALVLASQVPIADVFERGQAIFHAACDAAEEGVKVEPEVMIPLVGARKELEHQAAVVRRAADEVFAARGRKVKYLVGTMIEVPRGAITAAEIAQVAEFFSFGTNDLTQPTFGLSRDDTGPVLTTYLDKDILPIDPFVSIDRDGVGALMRIAVAGGRATRPGIKLGICGEHGGDPSSVAFCHEIGLDYVSCSPYRLPIARLAAAQAVLRGAAKPQKAVRDGKPARNGKAQRASARTTKRTSRAASRTRARA